MRKREDLPLKPIGFALAAVVAGLAPAAAQAQPARAPHTQGSANAEPGSAPAAERAQRDLFE